MRWPFAKKPKPTNAFLEEWNRAQLRVAALRAWRSVGQSFRYMGREMVVIGHSRVELLPGHFPVRFRLIPEVRARYVNNLGEVHTLEMSEAEVLALINETPGPASP